MLLEDFIVFIPEFSEGTRTNEIYDFSMPTYMERWLMNQKDSHPIVWQDIGVHVFEKCTQRNVRIPH